MRRTFPLLILLLAAGWPVLAADDETGEKPTAEDPPADKQQQVQQAQELFFEGLDLKEGGDCEGAVARFEQSLELFDGMFQARLHLAECYHGMGLDAKAIEQLEAYLAADFPGKEQDRAETLLAECRGDDVEPDDDDDDDDDDTAPDVNLIPDRPAVMVVGIHVGPGFSAFSPLGIAVLPRLEVGVALPFGGRRLQLFGTVAYQAPTGDGTVDDPRLAGETGDYDLLQHELMLGLGLNFRFLELGKPVNPYLAAGPQFFLLQTVANGEAAGAEFLDNTEQYTKIGVYGGVGLEIVIGPGALFIQAGVVWAGVDGLITGSSNIGALNPSLGYRFML